MTTDRAEVDRLRQALAQPLPHPDVSTMNKWSRETADWVARHWATLPEQPIGKRATRHQMEALLREPPPENGRPFAEVLATFERDIVPFAIRVNHPRFHAFVPSAPCFPAVLGDWLCAGVNFFAGVWLEASAPAQIELIVLDWFKEMLGCPAGARGILTGGGSEATLTALTVARERLSYDDRPKAVLYTTDHRHWSIDRAVKILGFRPDQIRAVATQADLRLRAEALADAVAEDRGSGKLPWAVIANAGATGTGAVDPLAELAEYCRPRDLWLQVDAAYGWPAVLTDEGRALLAGIGHADSITLDPHKWFAQTFEAGCVLIRDGHLLKQTFSQRPAYLQDVEPSEDEVNFADCGIALTRRFRALKIWISVQTLGLGWFRQLIERCCLLADYAEARLRQSPAFEIVHSRQLSIVVFRAVQSPGSRDEAALDALNLALVEKLLATGRGFLSSTKLNGRVALRFCFVNWRTTAGDVDEIIDLLEAMAAPLPGCE
jgi:glutamate/tyrosine decarboxylase-like PLP-dependent enzyme